jgi:hypothetical protein
MVTLIAGPHYTLEGPDSVFILLPCPSYSGILIECFPDALSLLPRIIKRKQQLLLSCNFLFPTTWNGTSRFFTMHGLSYALIWPL